MLWNYVEVEEELHFARPSLLNGITTQFVYPVITNVEYYCGGGTTLHIAARVNFKQQRALFRTDTCNCCLFKLSKGLANTRGFNQHTLTRKTSLLWSDLLKTFFFLMTFAGAPVYLAFSQSRCPANDA